MQLIPEITANLSSKIKIRRNIGFDLIPNYLKQKLNQLLD